MTDVEWAASLRAYDAQRAEYARALDRFYASIQTMRRSLDLVRRVWQPAQAARAIQRARYRERRYLRQAN